MIKEIKMNKKEEYDPETEFFCYLCNKIKPKVEHPPEPILFLIGGGEWVACAKCWDVLAALRKGGSK